MKRIPEAELMEGVEQAEAYALADFADVNARFVEVFLDRFPAFVRGSIVDLGCGPADISIRLARALPEARLVAVDGSRAMLRHARQALHAARLGERIELVECVLPGLGRCGRRFDAVISNSLLHHLREPALLWSELLEITERGAPILVVDLLRPANRTAARDIVETYASGERAILRADFYNSLLAAFTLDEVRAQLRDAGLERALRVEQLSDRHLCVSGTWP